MTYFYDRIVEFIEDPKNQPERTSYSYTSPSTMSNSIRRFVYSNQSVRIKLTRNLINNNPDRIKRVNEMDWDIKENNKFYEAGMSFCECDCSTETITLVKEIYDNVGSDETIIYCMVYGAELATEEFKRFVGDIAIDRIDFSPKIPEFQLNFDNTYNVSKFCENKYYPNVYFDNKSQDCVDVDKFHNEKIPVTLLYTNIPFEIYSECQNDIHQLNYNINYNRFVSLRKSIPRFQEICSDIQKNGMKTPIAFVLRDNNIVPIQNSSKILMAIMLGLPTIPACIFVTGLRYDYHGLYKESKNTVEKLNSLLYPYFILKHGKV